MALNEAPVAGVSTTHFTDHATLRAEFISRGWIPVPADFTAASTAAEHAAIHNILHARQNTLTGTTLPTNLTANTTSGHLSHMATLNAAYNTRAAGISQTLFTTQTPGTPNANDTAPLIVGTRFTVAADGFITGVRFHRATTAPTAPVVGLLYTDGGVELARATYGTLTTGWNTVSFASPAAVAAGSTYRVAYFSDAPYVTSSGLFPITNGQLTAIGGCFRYDTVINFPSNLSNNAYFADPIFNYSPVPPSVPAAPNAPGVSAGSQSVQVSWTAPAANGSPITGYSVQNVNTGTVTTVGNVTTTGITGLTNGTAYTFKVRATNSVGTGAYSAASAAATPVSSNGFPDSSTTGAKVTTTPYTGPTNLNVDGVVLDGISLTGQFTVNANNVTIKNSRITCNSTYGILVWGQNFTLTDCTIVGAAGQCSIAGYSDQGGGDIHILRCDMSGSPDLVRMGGNGSTVVDSYFHDVYGPSNGNTDAHNDTVGVLPGVLNTTINHNTILNAESQTSAVELGDTRSAQTSGTLTNNLLAGAGYTIYAMGSSGGIGWTVTGNKFSTRYYPNSGQFGPVTDFVISGANIWNTNTWADGPNSGQAVNP